MKKFFGFAAMLTLVLPLFFANAQQHPGCTKDKQCTSKTADKASCCSHEAKAMKTSMHKSCTGKATLMKTSDKKAACAEHCTGKTKAECMAKCNSKMTQECASKCPGKAKEASTEKTGDKN